MPSGIILIRRPEIKFDYAGLTGFFQKMVGHSKETLKVSPISITPFGDELVVTNSKNKKILGEREIETDAVVVWRIVDGKIKEAWDIPAVNSARVRTLISDCLSGYSNMVKLNNVALCAGNPSTESLIIE